jgi:hypothetical protein
LRYFYRTPSIRPCLCSIHCAFGLSTAGAPAVPMTVVSGDADRRRYRSLSSSPSRLRRARRSRRPSQSLSYSSDPGEYSKERLRWAHHRHRVTRSRTPSRRARSRRRGRVLRCPPGTENIEDMHGSHTPTATRWTCPLRLSHSAFFAPLIVTLHNP